MSSNIINLLWESFLETILMVGVSGGLGAAIGIPLGVFLFVTSPKGIMPKPYVNRIIGTIVNAVRSTPFIILLVAIIPFTRLIVGSSIGTVAAIVPLTIAAAPLIARLVETSLREVDKGLIEAAQSMGATNTQIICKVLLPEAMPGILAGLTIAFVALVGSSAMAGAVGGGGLGDMGIRYGYQRFMPEVMAAVVIILIVFVQSLQSFGLDGQKSFSPLTDPLQFQTRRSSRYAGFVFSSKCFSVELKQFNKQRIRFLYGS